MVELYSARLMLRPLRAADLDAAVALGADARVMKSLGGPLSPSESGSWLERLVAHWQRYGYGRYLVTREAKFVGFVGLSRFDFDRGIVPGVEVAWRLAFDEWGKGYATEAARAVIEHGFTSLDLHEIIGVTSVGNARSRRVMDRLGMQHAPHETFDHPLLPVGDPLRSHVIYRLTADNAARV
jgi:RimJ/RimL family protein N-acetyltransferase